MFLSLLYLQNTLIGKYKYEYGKRNIVVEALQHAQKGLRLGSADKN